MAQAVFHQHPLQSYLRDVGEQVDPIPGSLPEFAFDSPVDQDSDDTNETWIPLPVHQLLDTLRALFSTSSSGHASPFVEQFKYNVISSSLLSAAAHPTHHGSQTPHIPGRLTPARRTGSPDSSLARSPSSRRRRSVSPGPVDLSWVLSIGVAGFAAILSTSYYMLAMLWLAGTYSYYMYASNLDTRSKPAILSTLECLNDLITAGDVWDAVVHDAIGLLEKEEQSVFASPMNPTSPSSPLRVALHSSLHTTQTQCDNIRQLFAALTTPTELSQLSEMYAPPSPIKPDFSEFRDTPRPLSHPGSRIRTISSPSDDRSKRATWNGSYSSLALAGSPTMQVLKRREKRRSDISSLLEVTQAMRAAASAPATPLAGLTNADEEESRSSDISEAFFGAAALDLRRKRRISGLESFRLPNSAPSSSRFLSPTLSSGSRFTTIRTNRHPLSLSALHHALQGAFASKRYACAHLLALRFNEDEDDGYWEDVRSVMSLLTTVFADASSRLTEALEESERARIKDENPSPDSLPSHSRSTSLTDVPRRSAMSQALSFAPGPSHVARFAAHVDAITSGLNDARDHLEQCVAAVNTFTTQEPQPANRTPPRATPHENHAVEAYERLRRELGLALRECERGRERLLDIVAAAAAPRESSGDTDLDDLPGLGQDGGSDESDKADPMSPLLDRREMFGGLDVVGEDEEDGGGEDDVSGHLLLTASAKDLPPAGIEQVFEADTGPGVLFARERSKLTRDERIKLAKARRESGGGGLGLGLNLSMEGGGPAGGIERWGPGGEVVQELKDVIWKVGERRRKMTDGQCPVVVAASEDPF